MRRKRLQTPRGPGGPGGGGPQLPMVPGGASPAAASSAAPASDLRYLEHLVSIPFTLRAGRTYLQRHMGNPITFRLVEARRGEAVGMVREVEIRHADGGERSVLRGERLLPNGEPASFFVPDHLVTLKPRAFGALAQGRGIGPQDEVVLHVPVRGFLRFLPQMFQGEGPVQSRDVTRARQTDLQRWRGAELGELGPAKEIIVDEEPMRRFLFLFQHVMTSITDRIDRLPEVTDPLACDAKLLPWLASWVGFQLDESLPVHQQRELVRRAIRLMRTRGTRPGLEEMVRVLTAAPARLDERARPPAVVLGKAWLIGGRDVVERFQRDEPLGHFLFTPAEAKRGLERLESAERAVEQVYRPTDIRRDTSFFTLRLEPRERFRARFGERAGAVLRRIVNVLSQERPSHVLFALRFEEAAASPATRRAAAPPKE